MKKDYKDRGVAVPGDNSKPENWVAVDKLAVILDTSGLNSVRLCEYYRSNGLYPEQIDQWQTAELSEYQHSAQNEEEKNSLLSGNNRCQDIFRLKKSFKQFFSMIFGDCRTKFGNKLGNQYFYPKAADIFVIM